MKQKLKSGDEYDCVTKWRKYTFGSHGKWKKIKQQMNRRFRRLFKQNLNHKEDE